MRAYSNLSLLNKKLGLTGKKSGIGSILGSIFELKYVTLYIEIPGYDYVRGRNFVKDLKAILEDEMDPSFTVESIFVLLYADFLRQVRNGADLLDLAKLIMTCKRNFAKIDTPVEAELVSKNSFLMVREERPKRTRKENRPVAIPIRIYRDDAERGECLLYDMENLYPELDVTLEELISIRYREFMHEVKSGNNKIIKAVISNIRNG